MNGWMKLAAALFAAVSFAGCSLLKVAVATGDPLSKEQMNVRTMTRGFYYDMAGEVFRAISPATPPCGSTAGPEGSPGRCFRTTAMR